MSATPQSARSENDLLSGQLFFNVDSSNATPAERYTVLVDQLKANHTLFNEATRNTATLLLVALGWFIAIKTTTDPPLIKVHSSVAYIAILFVIVLGIAHILSLLVIRLRTQMLRKRLTTLAYAPATDTEHYNITWPHFFAGAVTNALLFVLIGVLLDAMAS